MIIVKKHIQSFLKEIRGAIHVGANVGEERDWYVQCGFKKVLWFEPNSEVFHILDKNILKYEGHRAFNFGIHDTLHYGTLHIANNKGQSSSLLDLGTHLFAHPEVRYVCNEVVRLMRMDSFFQFSGRDINDFNFLNVDVQGTELNVIKSFGALIAKMDYIYAEVNEKHLYVDCALIEEIDAYLATFGFKRVLTKITKAKWGDALYVR